MGISGKNTLVIRGGTLIDGDGGVLTDIEALVIAGNRIRHIGALPADIIILDADPVADISVLKGGHHVVTVIKDGRVIDRNSLAGKPSGLTFRDEAGRKSEAA